ncbi:MAG TPA: hypothetical protein VJT49_09155 [Amycolatopsis sp.]|uniref:hypothetical protein n=1 Tax=Amycolatopsis sp. TaxID=37632 RepID=UPI002B488CEB|nr:hypothetical protein [Amycolatopsis sp.]HKS45268.1 hypothetical protein [Amycolatopsis sp.]
MLAALLLSGGVLGRRMVVICEFAVFGLTSAGCALAPHGAVPGMWVLAIAITACTVR